MRGNALDSAVCRLHVGLLRCLVVLLSSRLCVERELWWMHGAGRHNAGSLSAAACVRVPALRPQQCTMWVMPSHVAAVCVLHVCFTSCSVAKRSTGGIAALTCTEVVGACCVTCVRASSGCCRFRQPAGMCVMSRPHNRQQHGACAFLHLARVALCIGLLGSVCCEAGMCPRFKAGCLLSLVCLLVLVDDDCVDYLQTVNSLPRLGWMCVYQSRQAALAAAGWLGDSRGCGRCSCPPILSGWSSLSPAGIACGVTNPCPMLCMRVCNCEILTLYLDGGRGHTCVCRSAGGVFRRSRLLVGMPLVSGARRYASARA